MIAGSNVYVYATTKKQVNASLEDADCILVLGAGVRNNKPTPMLNDRLEVAIQLYKDGKASKIIMSGDHGQEDYNEVDLSSYPVKEERQKEFKKLIMDEIKEKDKDFYDKWCNIQG